MAENRYNPTEMAFVTGLLGVFVLVVPLVAGVVLLRRGLRGDLIDDHPVCRTCGFDLFGAPPGREQCPECGAILTGPRAIIVGHRRCRGGFIMAGLAGTMFSLAAAAGIWWSEAAGYDLDRIKPVWWLALEGGSRDPLVSGNALNELARRLKNGTLTDERIAHVADRALAHQRDATRRWEPAWGLLVEQAHAARRLSRGQWEAYVRSAAEGIHTLDVRREVRRGDEIPIRLWWQMPRAAFSIPLTAEREVSLLAIDDIPIQPAVDIVTGSLPMNVGIATATEVRQALTPEMIARLADGPHELRYRINYTIRTQSGKPVQAVVDLRAPWTLVPSGAETVKLLRDEKLRPAVERAIIVEDLCRPSPRDERMTVTVGVDDLPVPVGYDVSFRSNGHEHPLGSMAFEAGKRWGLKAEGRVDDLSVRDGEIILRPSSNAARRTIGITKIWDGEVIVPHVPVRVSATQPVPTRVK